MGQIRFSESEKDALASANKELHLYLIFRVFFLFVS